MKSILSKIVLILLCFVFVVSAVSCGNTNTTQGDNTSSEAPTETGDPNDPKLNPIDWDGATFHVSYNGGTVERNLDFIAEDTNGEALNDAVYNRNLAIAEKYNLVLTYERINDSNIMNSVRIANGSGEETFQLVEANQPTSMSMAIEGYVHRYSELTCVNTSKPYWFASALAGSSIAGENYFAYCDANVYSFAETPCTIFNKKVAEDFKITNIYQLVKDRKWTFSQMIEMAKTVNGDLDGDQKITKVDRLGQISGPFAIDCLLSGTGYMTISKDDKDLPVLNINNETFINIVEAISDVCSEENGFFLGSRWGDTFETNQTWPLEAMTENRALFRIGNFFCVEELRSTDCEYGIVPIPMVNENQKDYKIHMQSNENGAIMVPCCVVDPYNVSSVLEDIAYLSSKSVMPTYQTILIEGKSVRDVESLECLRIIRESYYCDLGFMMKNYNIDILETVRNIVQNNKAAASTIQKYSGTFENRITKFRKSFGG